MIHIFFIITTVVWIATMVKNIKLNDTIVDLKSKNKTLQEKCTNLERSVRDEANKNIILESLIKQRPNQNEERKLY